MRAKLTVRDAVLMLAGVAVMVTSQVYLRPRKNDNGFSAKMFEQERMRAGRQRLDGGHQL